MIPPTNLWQHMGHLQDARKDILAIMATDMEVGAVRDAWDLPNGHFWGDRKEAFDSARRADFLVRLYDEAKSRGDISPWPTASCPRRVSG